MTLLYDALHAYLTPLITKHTSGKVLIYDDLISSWNSAENVLKQNATNGAHRIVSKRLEELHASQLRAYQEAAQTALKEYSQQCELGEEEEEDMEKAILSVSKPAWHVDDSVWQEFFFQPLKERLLAAQKKKKEAPEVDNHVHVLTSDDADDHDDEEEENEDDNDEIDEEEAMEADTEEPQQQEDTAVETAVVTKPIPKKKKVVRKKPGTGKTKVVRKAGVTAKQTAPSTVGGATRKRKLPQRGRRGGRGGGGGK